MSSAQSSVDDYLNGVPADKRELLDHLRELIRNEAPEAEEKISYGIPCFFQNGYLIGYAAAKKHLSLFPGAEPIYRLAEKLKGYSLSKGTIRFTGKNPLPDELIIEIIRLCKERNALRSEN